MRLSCCLRHQLCWSAEESGELGVPPLVVVLEDQLVAAAEEGIDKSQVRLRWTEPAMGTSLSVRTTRIAWYINVENSSSSTKALSL